MAADGFLDLLGQLLQCIVADVAALAGSLNTANKFVTAEWLGKAIAFNHQQNGFFNSGKTTLTRSAFSTAADRGTTINYARVNNARLFIVTERAIHGSASFLVVTQMRLSE